MSRAMCGRSASIPHVVNLFSECANAPTIAEFQDKLAELKRIGGAKIEEFLVKIPFEHWANAWFQGCRYGEMCSTLAEFFNAWIKEERSMHVTAMLYHIRRKMMKMFDDRCRECFSWCSELCLVMESVYCAKVDVARSFRVVRSNEVEFEVEDVIVHHVNVERRVVVLPLPCPIHMQQYLMVPFCACLYLAKVHWDNQVVKTEVYVSQQFFHKQITRALICNNVQQRS
ncbi:hypothetical protein IFM89_011423 [Coptis chinensis]|uniref:Uncharacterized protein n=1 Tax=Coptis chinensis TaxID=261450 RepID=A0A835HJD2_9MAGN|nr:hypothetical protein IFM89_011423 [Coptis chinensis]